MQLYNDSMEKLKIASGFGLTGRVSWFTTGIWISTTKFFVTMTLHNKVKKSKKNMIYIFKITIIWNVSHLNMLIIIIYELSCR